MRKHAEIAIANFLIFRFLFLTNCGILWQIELACGSKPIQITQKLKITTFVCIREPETTSENRCIDKEMYYSKCKSKCK